MIKLILLNHEQLSLKIRLVLYWYNRFNRAISTRVLLNMFILICYTLRNKHLANQICENLTESPYLPIMVNDNFARFRGRLSQNFKPIQTSYCTLFPIWVFPHMVSHKVLMRQYQYKTICHITYFSPPGFLEVISRHITCHIFYFLYKSF